jgi:hypothetical protein
MNPKIKFFSLRALPLAMVVPVPATAHASWLRDVLQASPFVVLALFWILIPTALIALVVTVVRRSKPAAKVP